MENLKIQRAALVPGEPRYIRRMAVSDIHRPETSLHPRVSLGVDLSSLDIRRAEHIYSREGDYANDT